MKKVQSFIIAVAIIFAVAIGTSSCTELLEDVDNISLDNTQNTDDDDPDETNPNGNN
jgi:hypothetical protein